MKYWLFLIMTFIVTSFNIVSYVGKSVDHSIQGSLSSKQDPFYFLTPVPASVKLFDKINLSFFRNKLLVVQYRYRLQTPYGSQTEIDGRFIIWSSWIKDDLTEIKIPRLDQEGGYKLIIEYKPQTGNETKKFEKVFYVYYVNPMASAEAAKSKKQPQASRSVSGSTTVADRTTSKTTPNTPKEKPISTPARTTANQPGKTPPGTNTESTDAGTAKTSAKPAPVAENMANETRRIYDKRLDLRGVKIAVNIRPEIISQAENLTAESSEKKVIINESAVSKYEILLTDAIEKKDSVLFRESVQNGAGRLLKGKNGGNIFHLMNDAFAGEKLISILKDKGFSINETDNSGNSPLHLAILLGYTIYTHSLINQGADLNIKNNLDLSPLHLAVLLNDIEVADELLSKGADINLKGNTGYAPLHIATEMNYIGIANNLLLKGARKGIKTRQGLSPKAIARIQDYNEMVKLITKKGSDTLSPPKSISVRSIIDINSRNQVPVIDFNLPYDKELAKKRQFNKAVQIISIPAFALSTAYATYLKTQANHYYSLSKIAETEEIAKYYYDKTVRFDTFAYISGGISLVSAYGVIHSTIRKLSLSKKMVKAFN